jgi:hypothetical protein
MGVRLGPFSSIVVFAIVGGRSSKACIIIVLKLAEHHQSHAHDVGHLITSPTLLNVYCPPPPPHSPPAQTGHPIARLHVTVCVTVTIGSGSSQ